MGFSVGKSKKGSMELRVCVDSIIVNSSIPDALNCLRKHCICYLYFTQKNRFIAVFSVTVVYTCAVPKKIQKWKLFFRRLVRSTNKTNIPVSSGPAVIMVKQSSVGATPAVWTSLPIT